MLRMLEEPQVVLRDMTLEIRSVRFARSATT